MRGEADELLRLTVEYEQDPRVILRSALCKRPVEELCADHTLDLEGPLVVRIRARKTGQELTVFGVCSANAPRGLRHRSITTGMLIVNGTGLPRRYAASAAETRSKPFTRVNGEYAAA